MSFFELLIDIMKSRTFNLNKRDIFGISLKKKTVKNLVLTAYKQLPISRKECRRQTSRSFSTRKVNIADWIVVKTHIQRVEYKWSGQHAEIGTCLQIKFETKF